MTGKELTRGALGEMDGIFHNCSWFEGWSITG